MTTRIKPDGQTDRLIRWLRENPGSTGLEIVKALSLPKYTSRISDARAAGVNVVCVRRDDGRRVYYVTEPYHPEPIRGTQMGAFG